MQIGPTLLWSGAIGYLQHADLYRINASGDSNSRRSGTTAKIFVPPQSEQGPCFDHDDGTQYIKRSFVARYRSMGDKGFRFLKAWNGCRMY
ncbi:hypothetical protein LL912_21360 [Niabella sp. CC-SYL272]|uniref:hypothetical protein n=1 Tax=Niabella agricola TaxID=2891571 RepID=UPI001F39390C|nr:hypothetical protein [Niabella agricola]MCF3111349.1 hypothetical protein [Niabella agricola]